jgi:small GTP-binding protein
MSRKRLAVVGMPNVGKSVLFNALTGTYATVSNYPGTTVEVMWGHANISGIEFDIVDTPGAYSLLPLTEDERVTLLLLLNEDFDIVLHVVDARCLRRMLAFTLFHSAPPSLYSLGGESSGPTYFCRRSICSVGTYNLSSPAYRTMR